MTSGAYGEHPSARHAGQRAAGWVFASSASVVAGVAGTLAASALIAGAGSGGWISFGLACTFGLVAAGALYAGRRARAKSHRERSKHLILPPLSKDDYSGLPAPSPADVPNAFTVAFASTAGFVSLLLFPIGIAFAGVGGCLGATSLVLVGIAIAALGPVILASTWISRR